MRRKGIDYYDWTDDDEEKLIQLISDSGLSKTNYTMESKINILHDTYVSKSMVVDCYFDDILNILEPNEDIVKYINEIKNSWNK